MKIAEFKTEGHYQAFSPKNNLRDLVKEYWVFDLHKSAPHSKKELIQPSLFPEIIFKIGGDYENHNIKSNDIKTVKSTIISGIQEHAIASKRINTDERLFLIGIKFHHLGMHKILNMPLIEILNKRLSLDEIPNQLIQKLEAELYNQKEVSKIIVKLDTLLSNYFQGCITKNENIEFVKKINLAESNKIYSHKNNRLPNYKFLERKFKKYIGITPTKYFKIKRYLQFYQQWLQYDQYKYIELVYKNNYYDQNHLIKDFKSIIAQSPNKFKKTKDHFYTEHIIHARLED